MSDGNLLLTLRQINICLGLYESEKLAASEMTFAQAFLLNEIFSMDSSCVCSTELCERVGFYPVVYFQDAERATEKWICQNENGQGR